VRCHSQSVFKLQACCFIHKLPSMIAQNSLTNQTIGLCETKQKRAVIKWCHQQAWSCSLANMQSKQLLCGSGIHFLSRNLYPTLFWSVRWQDIFKGPVPLILVDLGSWPDTNNTCVQIHSMLRRMTKLLWFSGDHNPLKIHDYAIKWSTVAGQ